MTPEKFDIIVIGAGIAGASVAATLAGERSVILLEQEDQAGLHSTGRSAAMFFEAYGNASIRALSRASRSFFTSPPRDFAQAPLLKARNSLIIASPEQRELLEAFLEDADMSQSCREIAADEIVERCPLINREKIIGGLLESDSFDIDVDGLHQGFLRQFKSKGGIIRTQAGARAINQADGNWTVQTSHGAVYAPIVVNAAGAWADIVAEMAGVSPLGLEPRRRTAILVPVPDNEDISAYPMVMDIGEQFYLKPDAGLLLVSPADETLTDACDAQAEELDIAIAVDRLETISTLSIKRVAHRWAGLRTFARDRTPVVGFDAKAAGFFWLAGQGGYGIQTAPAIAELAASLILEEAMPEFLQQAGVDASAYAPSRLQA